MSRYVVTNKAIKLFLSSFQKDSYNFEEKMNFKPGFVKEIRAFLESFPDINKLGDESYVFNENDIHRIIDIVDESFADSDGRLMTDAEANALKLNFKDYPIETLIDDISVQDFLDAVNKINLPALYPDRDLEVAFRFYFGHSPAMGVDPNKYGGLLVPICSPKVASGVQRDHSLDLEMDLINKMGTRFALAISESVKGVITNRSLWQKVAANADQPFSLTELAYYSLAQFTRFRNGINSAVRDKMSISFGRISMDKEITGIVSFLNSAGNRLNSSVLKSGVLAVGSFFDQGDLIPPPNPVADKSF